MENELFQENNQDSCSDILKWGIWSTSYKYSESEFAEKTIEFFQNNKIYSKTSTIDAAFKAGITIPLEGLNIPMNLDGTFGSNRSKYYSDAIVNFFSRDYSFKQRYIESNVTADRGIVDAWMKCQELRYSDLTVMSASPIYSKISETDMEDQIAIEITARILPENFGKVTINRKRLVESLENNGCRLLQSQLDPLINGKNTIQISRSSLMRGKEGFISISTNMLSYQCVVKLKKELSEDFPYLPREIGTNLERKIDDKFSTGSNEFTFQISNDKDKDVILRIEAFFQIYGINERVDLYLFAAREGEELKELVKLPIQRWNYWLRQPLSYDVDIPFFRNSPIKIKAAFYSWDGEKIDLHTANIHIICKY